MYQGGKLTTLSCSRSRDSHVRRKWGFTHQARPDSWNFADFYSTLRRKSLFLNICEMEIRRLRRKKFEYWIRPFLITCNFLEPPPDAVPLREGVIGRGGFCMAAICWYFLAVPFDHVRILEKGKKRENLVRSCGKKLGFELSGDAFWVPKHYLER